MLARVSSNKLGIVDYLKNGHKSGRSLSRDELDDRVCIDGDLNLTDEVIKQLNIQGKDNNYLHITLSYAERDLTESKIVDSYNQYKELLMSAYNVDEFNVYAEIHYPKVKSYVDKKTGEVVERFPHVHMVIPNRNMVTEKNVNPFGKYTDNIKYHDAIQETVNRTHNLESPYDNQRLYRTLGDDSEFISRYKGDEFNGSNKQLKETLFDAINDKNIRTMQEFEKELAKHGEVSKGKAGAVDEYYQVKLPGKTKNIRLKHTCFSAAYIENRELTRPKPSDKQIASDLKDWIDTRSLENKYVRPLGERKRKEYYKLDEAERQQDLLNKQAEYNKKYKLDRSDTRAGKRKNKAASSRTLETKDLEQGLPDITRIEPGEQRSTATDSSQSPGEPSEANQDISNQAQSNQVKRTKSADNKPPAATAFRTTKDLEATASRDESTTVNKTVYQQKEEISNVDNQPTPRRGDSKQQGTKRARAHRLRQPANQRDGLPSLSSRHVDGSERRAGRNQNASVLLSDKHNRLGRRQQHRNHELRRFGDRRRVKLAQGFKQGVKEGIPGVRTSVSRQLEKPTSLIDQYQLSTYKTPESDRIYFARIRRNIDPESILNHFEKSHGLIKRNYSIEAREDGTPRIRIGDRAYTASDFCTKHMRLEWNETKTLLSKLYQEQLTKREEQHELNSIVFASDYTTQGYNSKAKLSRINESMQIFRYLQNKEQYEDRKMTLSDTEAKHRTNTTDDNENAIATDEISYKSITDNYQRQQQLAQSLTVRLSDIVASKDLKDKYVDFSDKTTGQKIFRDHGHKIVMNQRNPDVNHVAAAMALASEKFGTVKINGSKEFKQQVIDVAVAKDLNIVFKDKKLQEHFVKCKEDAKQNALLEQAAKKHDTPTTQSEPQATDNNLATKAGELGENPVAAAIREGLNNAEKVKEDLATIQSQYDENVATAETNDVSESELKEMAFGDSDIVERTASKHVDMLEKLKGTAGYKIIEDAMLSGAENAGYYKSAVDSELEARQQQAKAEASQATTATATVPKADEPLVTLVGHGSAPYLYKKGNKESYYAELSNGEVKWGVGLKDAIKESKAKVGDVVEIDRVGQTDVQVRQSIKDQEGNFVRSEMVDTHRNEWQVTVTGKTLEETPIEQTTTTTDVKSMDDKAVKVEETVTTHDKPEQPTSTKQAADKYEVEYKFNQDKSTLTVTVNGQDPSTVETKVLVAIQQQDKFLNKYTLAQVQAGELSQRQAKGVQPVPQTYNSAGDVISQDSQNNAPTLK